MSLRLKQLEQRVLGEAMGWHQRTPYALTEWVSTPEAMLTNLRRIDSACAALLAEQKKAKAAKALAK